MTYDEALKEIDRIRKAERTAFDERLKLLPPTKPFDMKTASKEEVRQRIKEVVREGIDNPDVFHRIRKRSRGRRELAYDHPDGRPRWVGGFPMEGGPESAYWQRELAKAPLLTQKERAEDDWWIEAYDPMDF